MVRRVVAENVNTPQETLRILARERLPRDLYSGANVRAAVAGNPSCPVDLLDLLAKDKSAEVRGYIGRNPSTNVDTLMLLAQDNDPSVRANVAVNSSATFEIKMLASSLRLAASD